MGNIDLLEEACEKLPHTSRKMFGGHGEGDAFRAAGAVPWVYAEFVSLVPHPSRRLRHEVAADAQELLEEVVDRRSVRARDVGLVGLALREGVDDIDGGRDLPRGAPFPKRALLEAAIAERAGHAHGADGLELVGV